MTLVVVKVGRWDIRPFFVVVVDDDDDIGDDVDDDAVDDDDIDVDVDDDDVDDDDDDDDDDDEEEEDDDDYDDNDDDDDDDGDIGDDFVFMSSFHPCFLRRTFVKWCKTSAVQIYLEWGILQIPGSVGLSTFMKFVDFLDEKDTFAARKNASFMQIWKTSPR